MNDDGVRKLVEVIAKALAEYPDEIVVKEIVGHQISVIELHGGKE